MRNQFAVYVFTCLVIIIVTLAHPFPAQAETTSVLDTAIPQGRTASKTTPSGTLLHGRLVSANDFQTPLVITAVVKTDSTNIRLDFNDKGLIIFNWELGPDEFRHRDPATNKQSGVPGKGAVPINTFVTIVWSIDEKHSKIFVDGVERASFDGDYKGLSGKVGICTYSKAILLIKSLQVTTGHDAQGVQPATGEVVLGPADFDVPTCKPSATVNASPSQNSPDPNAIERPQYANKNKSIVKNITSVSSMMVRIGKDGNATGVVSDIIATVRAESRHAEKAGIGFVGCQVDSMMKTGLDEAVRAITLRYPYWEPGHIDLSFGEKFNGHGGPSASAAFSLLMLSALEGIDLDSKCAITGDITVDWKVRKVGGVTSKIRGATLDKYLYAAIPEDNDTSFNDMAILYGHSSLWNIQVFSIATLQDAVALVRRDRAPNLVQAIQAFDALKAILAKDESILKTDGTRATLKHILTLAPNHLSAKQLLAISEGTADRTLSANGTLYQLSIILYPFRVLLHSGQEINRNTLPVGLIAAARKRIDALQLISNPDLHPLLRDVRVFIEAMDGFAGKYVSLATLQVKTANLEAGFTNLSTDPEFVEKLVHEGY